MSADVVNVLERAIARARAQSRGDDPLETSECLRNVRRLYGVAALYPDARSAWDHAVYRHPVGDSPTRRAETPSMPVTIEDHLARVGRFNPPAGVPVWWSGGSHGDGHVAVASHDRTRVWSTDIRRPGFFDLVDTVSIAYTWGLTLLGWTQDVNGRTLCDGDGRPL